MNLKLVNWGATLMLALATMSVAAPAFADNDRRGRDHGHHDRGHDRRDDRRDARRDYRDARRDYREARRDYRDDRHDYRRDDRHDRRRDYYRGYRPPVRVVHHRPTVRYYPAPVRYAAPPRWSRGHYVHHYSRPVYVVNDYHGYGLRYPPRGYRWMRDDYGDFLLVAVATGLIADLILR